MEKNTEGTSTSPLELKSVQELLDAHYDFYVPGYQRGYRWRPKEIEVFINDLSRFGYEEDKKGEKERCPFYCLQAIVLKESEEHGLEVIDGQQRLTTVLILLQSIYTLKEYRMLSFIIESQIKGSTFDSSDFPWVDKDLYSIKYETREESFIWLENITKAYIKDKTNKNEEESDKLRNTNSDYYHFIEAYIKAIDIIKSWTEKQRTDFKDILCERTRFIWYNTSLTETSDKDVDIFDRLNATKIDLNNAELIKALFLQKDNFGLKTHEREQLAIDWDRIEKRLQEPSFWGFVYSTRHHYSYTTHIEYIFDLLAKKTAEDEDYYHFTFNNYYKDYPKDVGDRLEFVQKCWKKVQEMILTLEEWFSDKTCYHYIGYLLEYGMEVETNKPIAIPYLVEKLTGITKDQRVKTLKEMIKHSLKDIKPTKLFYGKPELTQVLFLLNIQTEENRNSDTARFSFSDFKIIDEKPGWHQEHVASHVDYSPDFEDRKGLAFVLLEYFTGVTKEDDMVEYQNKVKINMPEEKEAELLCEDLLDFFNDNNNITEERINNVYANVLDYFDTKGDDAFRDDIPVGRGTKDEKDFIWNFVLLNATTNMSYGNSIFPIKRQRIMSDDEYIYTPVCTRAVFEKAFSHKLTNLMTWGRKDAQKYWEYICKCLADFLPDKFELPFKF